MGKIMMVSKPTGNEEEGQTEGQIEKSHFYPQHIRYIDTLLHIMSVVEVVYEGILIFI